MSFKKEHQKRIDIRINEKYIIMYNNIIDHFFLKIQD